MRPLLYGEYRVRYTEVDEDLEASSCETVLSAGTRDALRVELVWNPRTAEELHPSDVDLHLLHPDATAWWDSTLDCYFGNRNPLWDDGVSTDDDPRLDVDDVDGRGPENINVLAPAFAKTYRVGVHYYSDHGYGPAEVYLKVFCHNQLSREYGPVTLSSDAFWKVADVTVDATSCSITTIGAPGIPEIVTNEDSRLAR